MMINGDGTTIGGGRGGGAFEIPLFLMALVGIIEVFYESAVR